MKKVTVSAPGKLMLLGEHAVVYDQPCLVTAVESRLEVTVEASTASGVAIDAPQVKDTRFVDAAISLFLQKFSPDTVIPAKAGIQEMLKQVQHDEASGLKISTKSPFSGKFGFGSSSAVTVATLKALSLFYEKPLSERELFDLSYKVVMEVQGTGSGFDVAAASFGGTLYFKKGGATLEPLKTNWDTATLVVGYSGVKSNTVELINHVAKLKDAYSEKFNRLIKSIGELVDQAKEALHTRDWKHLGTLMDFNQEYLRDLGVSTENLEAPIKAAKQAGAYGAKLSGAGGGDCMIAVTPLENKTAVEEAITKAGGAVIPVELDATGAREEITSPVIPDLIGNLYKHSGSPPARR